jgi:hypothetical protein
MARPFSGVVNVDIRDSEADWAPFEPPKAPDGAPNVLYVVLDDVGYSAMSCYGGPIETPNIDRIASQGVRYTQWHTTALCSPTRSCLLTGRNHTRNSMACITEAAIGFPNASGSRFGGHALYVKDNRLHYVNSFVGITEQLILATEDLPTGENLILSASFEKEAQEPSWAAGTLSLYHGAIRRWAKTKSKPSWGRSRSPARACTSGVTVVSRSQRTTQVRPPTDSPAGPSIESRSTSAASRMSLSSAKQRRCSSTNEPRRTA